MIANIINESGSFAIGARLRRLYESLVNDMTLIYQEQGLPLETKDFIFYYLMSKRSSISISDIAKELNLTHPAVIHIAKSLENIGYIESEKSTSDSRKRLVKLTKKGQKDLAKYRVLWDDIIALNQEMFEQQVQLLQNIEKLEEMLKEKTYYQRYHSLQASKKDA
ncbi:DNA-binding MarR family transcriptional regulator [Pedobacter cryoconitis]|uniref:DNA-binding MarR family transcriptional regulator n=1 Tax=Pedobacter cryoconitis TaxID=188932 RepID=A0A7W9DZ42_9SPHI|nr:MarR family transcriptional regulator [Pedobacter cryoconitis]MBB5635155.1 DNA-binding MarR family transcriptional regulator [Pedobacter cryoconitis]MBB6271661.1 DNA-binding MarR family transcriptional regulator [Pedobacter cryoconitis]